MTFSCKTLFYLSFLCVSLFGCKGLFNQDKSAGKKSKQSSEHTVDQSVKGLDSAGEPDGEAYASLYLLDALESEEDLGEEKDNEEGASEEPDPTNKDLNKNRLDLMIDMLMEMADVDESGDLTSEEFLAVRISEIKLPESAIENIKARRARWFEKFAGDDKLLSEEELRTLLKARRGHVRKLRLAKFSDYARRVRRFWASIVAEYDEDGDGKLNAAERQNFRAARKQARLERRKKFLGELCQKRDALKNRPICQKLQDDPEVGSGSP